MSKVYKSLIIFNNVEWRYEWKYWSKMNRWSDDKWNVKYGWLNKYILYKYLYE